MMIVMIMMKLTKRAKTMKKEMMAMMTAVIMTEENVSRWDENNHLPSSHANFKERLPR